MKAPTISVLGLDICQLSLDETAAWISDRIKLGKTVIREDINAFKFYLSKRDKTVKDILERADLINADGASIVLATRFLAGKKLYRVTGVDLMQKMVSIAAEKNLGVFLLGSSEEVVRYLASSYEDEYGSEIISGYRNGYFDTSEEQAICENIRNSGATMLFIGTPSPMKEGFILRNQGNLNDVRLIMGVGGSFDVLSGKIPRAPAWMQRNCLEWLFRLIQEPRKMWKRYLFTNTFFVHAVLAERARLWLMQLRALGSKTGR